MASSRTPRRRREASGQEGIWQIVGRESGFPPPARPLNITVEFLKAGHGLLFENPEDLANRIEAFFKR
jgi:hypothetical protein